MGHLKVIASALFALAVLLKLVYIVVKTIRIAVLHVDLPMVGFDSEDEIEAIPRADSGQELVGVVSGAEDTVASLLDQGEAVVG